MCIIDFNRYACGHAVPVNVDACHEKRQGLPCVHNWIEAGYRLGECMACLMREPAGQTRSSSPDADHEGSELDCSFVGRQRLRESRFADLRGYRWHREFPEGRAFRPQDWMPPR